MDKLSPATRSCLKCGEDKPLASFLQLTGAQGTVYGNICSSCRSTGKKTSVSDEDDTDSDASGGGGYRIDAKTKIQADIQQKELTEKSRDTHLNNLEKRETATSDKQDERTNQQKNEKDHRKSLEEKKSTRFLGFQNKTQPDNAAAFSAAETDKQEMELASIDTTQTYRDSTRGEIKYQSTVFEGFRTRLQGAHFNAIKAVKQSPTSGAQAERNPASSAKPLSQEVERIINPSSKRR